MSKRDISSKDKYRVLLTDTLPYETPIIFSNEGLYEYLNGNNPIGIVQKIINKKLGSTKPYRFSIRKGVDSIRTLSIPHPSAQMGFVDLYERYDSLIIDLCTRSEFSLRRPSKVASAFYEKRQLAFDLSPEQAVEEERQNESTQQKFASSYFAYSKYNFIHKFYDSYEFHRLEKKYDKQYKFDISKCFPSIYTHTIAWAVKNKRYAKRNKSAASFEKQFDRCMQLTNDLETHGIVVGPEFSRIFAEIILQRIDADVLAELKNEGYRHKTDYSIRRYIDDYFVFYNNPGCLKKIKDVFNKHLENYKLFINESKCFDYERPFITQISAAKMEVGDFIGWFGNTTLPTNLVQEVAEMSSPTVIRRPPHLFSNKCIARFKAILKQNDIAYNPISRLSLATLNKYLAKFIRKTPRDITSRRDSEKIKRRLWIWLDFMFFTYSMDVTPRTTHIVSRSLFYIHNFLVRLKATDSEDIVKKIKDECASIVLSSSRISKKVTIEICNLLITMAALGDDYHLSSKNILRGFNIDESDPSLTHLDYFSIMSLLFCMGDRPSFSNMKDLVGYEIVNRIQHAEDFLSDTEPVLLFLDSTSCKYLPQDIRHSIAGVALQKIVGRTTPGFITSTLNFISGRKWFMDWESAVHFDEILSKKELRTPY